ncbi:rhomboid family intramembrane serine protease [Streptomyces beijiangensis]|uniref:Rhomboid family intramembrane serine protease n=1 Tax=Streptomyces beijiangensis TaxID=163361 RepID=A0A939F1Q8_9ACTN|nr:rhomboid family intramembrane serine protease [Streptomyces beijiangensis]MBO0510891.1 rhomboid family intramembrane serine protease [Streptomyces beijiangensis]
MGNNGWEKRWDGRAKAAALLMAGWVALLWLLEVIDVSTGHALDAGGITPRRADELPDILSAPFLHGSFGHLAGNTVPLLILGFVSALSGIRRFASVVLTVILVSGLGVWLISPANSITLGASGVVFGLFGYLLVRGFVNRSPVDVVVGVVVAAVYGSILWGVLPTDAGISWQAHLFGLVGGVSAAFVFRRPTTRAAVTNSTSPHRF